MIKLICPLHIKVWKKNIAINLNTYRNLHYAVESSCKKKFCSHMQQQLQWKKFNKPILVYVFYYGRWGKHDKLNAWAIVSKYLLDAMVEYWCIVDDSDEYVWYELFSVWWIDRENPRCEVLVFNE